MNSQLVAGLGTSLAVGLLIGLERQQSMARKSGEVVPAGIRTFPLLALAGSLMWLLGGGTSALPAAGLLVLVALLGVHRLGLAVEQREQGVTTEAAAVVTFLLGMLAVADGVIVQLEPRLLTVGALGALVALLLSIKPRMQAIVRRISADDLFGTLQLLVVALVLLPLLPDAGLGPYGAINPAHTGQVILLVGGVSWIGFVASRLLGAGRGLVVSGIVGGLVASTVVTFTMARRAKQEPEVVNSCAVAIALANAVMLARVLVMVSIIAPALGARLALPIGAMCVAGLATLVPQLRALRSPQATSDVAVTNPFELRSATLFGLVFAVVAVIVHAIRDTLGDDALVPAGLLAGLTDVDAMVVSAATLANGDLELSIAGATVLAAVVSNTAVKLAISAALGGRVLALKVLSTIGVTFLVGVVVTLAMW